MQQNNTHIAFKVSIKSILVNTFLFIFKFICGLIIHSSSLISDAIHSLSDIFSTGIVMLGIKISNNPSDESHPYGHEKIETIIALGLGVILFYIGVNIGYDGIIKIIHPKTNISINIFLNIIGMTSAISSIVFKEWLYRFTIKCARKINSKAMEADAWHHRTDAFSSVGSLIGVIGITCGLTIIDSIACLVISVFIFKAAFDIVKDSFNNLVDHACSKEIINQIKEQIYLQKDVILLDTLKTRMFGAKIYIDVEITVDKNLTLQQAHKIASTIHDNIENNIPNVKHCMIHVNPTDLVSHHHI